MAVPGHVPKQAGRSKAGYGNAITAIPQRYGGRTASDATTLPTYEETLFASYADIQGKGLQVHFKTLSIVGDDLAQVRSRRRFYVKSIFDTTVPNVPPPALSILTDGQKKWFDDGQLHAADTVKSILVAKNSQRRTTACAYMLPQTAEKLHTQGILVNQLQGRGKGDTHRVCGAVESRLLTKDTLNGTSLDDIARASDAYIARNFSDCKANGTRAKDNAGREKKKKKKKQQKKSILTARALDWRAHMAAFARRQGSSV